MAELTDVELRRELKSLGMKDIGPITSGTRPLYIKKLNTLRSEKSKNIPSRRLIGFSSDESEGELEKRSLKTRTRASASHTKRKTKTATKPPVKKVTEVVRSSPRRSSRTLPSRVNKKSVDISHSARYVQDDDEESDNFDVSVASAAVHASLYRSMHSKNDLSASHYSDDRFDSSESEDEMTSRLLTPSSDVGTRNMSINTSAWMNDSDLFNRTYDRSLPIDESDNKPVANQNLSRYSKSRRSQHLIDSHNASSHSNTPAQEPIRRRNLRSSIVDGQSNNVNGSNTPVQNSSSFIRSHINNLQQRDNALVEEDTIREQGFETVENPKSYKRAHCISKVLVVVLIAFFLMVLCGYLYMRGMPLPLLTSSSDPYQSMLLPALV